MVKTRSVIADSKPRFEARSEIDPLANAGL
jgi:hypothetical protein